MASALQKQESIVSDKFKSEGQVDDAEKQISLNTATIVMERSLKSKKAHTGKMLCLLPVTATEFFTSSDDMSFKVWDSVLKGISYTYETHEPVGRMRVTGEKLNLLISSQGVGKLIVIGLGQRNQHDIIENAHDNDIIQIETLSRSKLSNRYFATRDCDGDVSIWSATPHPDKVFTLENVDADENQSNIQDTERKEQTQPIPVQEIIKQEEEEPEEKEGEEEELDEDGNPIKKKKPKVVVVKKKDKSGRISSDKDLMIEIDWKHTVIQSSATVLCLSNYRESFVNLATIDVKTRRKINLKNFQLQNKPTCLFQIDENNMLFGTEFGKIEHWVISNDSYCLRIYDCHLESEAGISQIRKLESKSHLLRGEVYKENEDKQPSFYLIATASAGSGNIALWKIDLQNMTLNAFQRIETSLTDGILYLREMGETTLVAGNQQTIKFYEFIDKNEISQKEEEEKRQQEVNNKMKEIFQNMGSCTKDLKIPKNDVMKYFNNVNQTLKLAEINELLKTSELCFEDVWHEMDFLGTNLISWHQIRFFWQRMIEHQNELIEEENQRQQEMQERLRDLYNRRAMEEQRKREEEEEARMRAEAEENE